MPSASVTITAKTGPDRTNTALALSNVVGIEFDFNAPAIFIKQQTGAGDNIKEYDLTGVTTLTCTISSGNYAFTIS